jgi:hypothetical protein
MEGKGHRGAGVAWGGKVAGGGPARSVERGGETRKGKKGKKPPRAPGVH